MTHPISISFFQSPVGELILGSYENKLCLCDWKYRKQRTNVDNRIRKFLSADFKEGSSEVIENTITQLMEYFNQERTEFDIPLLLCGTEFQQSVWNQLLKIPYGKTQTYLGLSRELSNEKAIRAVGTANGANAISILIPCHRIIGSDGSLVGYAGGLSAKKKLLSIEKVSIGNQLQLF